MKDLTKMTKEELIAQITAQTEALAARDAEIDKVKDAAGGRKLQCLKILKSEGHITVEAISKRIGISARNVSSQLTYLRKDGHAIATDSLGRKFLEDAVVVEAETKPATILRKA